MKKVLVTGATGFIGGRLVARLLELCDDVVCVVRNGSGLQGLETRGCSIVRGDVCHDSESLQLAMSGVDTVFHLAAVTSAVRPADLIGTNTRGMRNVLDACAFQSIPPKLIFISSLAAVGPSVGQEAHYESDLLNPISPYGESKAECERLASEYSSRVPVSIVRPPIVLGGGDLKGLRLFRAIEKLGVHFVNGFTEKYFSVIHVDDLTTAIVRVAQDGLPVQATRAGQGVYFVSANETPSYAELGRIIGRELGQRRTPTIPVPRFFMLGVASINELVGRVTQRPAYLNLGKIKDAFAGSWICSNQKILDELDFSAERSFADRVAQTVASYRDAGLLASSGKVPPAGPVSDQGKVVKTPG